MADPCTKFKVSRLAVERYFTGCKILKQSPDPDLAPFREYFFIGRLGLAMINLCTKFKVVRVAVTKI